jgi:hypothetical protein
MAHSVCTQHERVELPKCFYNYNHFFLTVLFVYVLEK